MSSTQLVVIGAGPGGYAAAFYAADLGMQRRARRHRAESRRRLPVSRVHPVEGAAARRQADRRSEACLGVGRDVRRAEDRPRQAARVQEQRRPEDDRRRSASCRSTRKVNYIQGKASFVDPKTLSIELVKGGTETLTFEHAIIATGSRPATVPGLSIDSPRVMDSTGGLDLPDIPKSLLVVGGGYIGLELGSVYAALGTQGHGRRDDARAAARRRSRPRDVPRPAPREDVPQDPAERARRRDEGRKNGVKVKIEGEGLGDADKEQTFDRVLVSVGRKPNSAVPGLDKTKVKVGDAGSSRSTPRAARTSRTSSRSATSSASRCWRTRRRTRRASPSKPSPDTSVAFEPQAIPAVVFTDPEVAWCGLTETEAKKQGRKVEVAKFPWAALGRARGASIGPTA